MEGEGVGMSHQEGREMTENRSGKFNKELKRGQPNGGQVANRKTVGKNK